MVDLIYHIRLLQIMILFYGYLNPSNLKFGFLPVTISKMRLGGTSNKNIKNIIIKSKEDYRAILDNNVGGLLTLVKKNTSKLFQFINR